MFGKGDGLTRTTGTTGTTDAMDVVLRLHRQTKVKDVSNGRYVDTTCCHIRSYQDAHITATQLLQAMCPHLLRHGAMKRRHGMTLLRQHIGQAIGFDLGAGEYNGLLQISITQVMIQQLFLMDQVIRPVQRLGNLFVTIRGTGQFESTRLLHQARGQRHDARREGGREHQCLVTMLTEVVDVFQIFGKAQIQHTVGFVNDQRFNFSQMNLTTLRQVQQTTRCGHYDERTP